MSTVTRGEKFSDSTTIIILIPKWTILSRKTLKITDSGMFYSINITSIRDLYITLHRHFAVVPNKIHPLRSTFVPLSMGYKIIWF